MLFRLYPEKKVSVPMEVTFLDTCNTISGAGMTLDSLCISLASV